MTGLAFAFVALYAVTMAGWLIRRLVLTRDAKADLEAQINAARVDLTERAANGRIEVDKAIDECRNRLAKLEFGNVTRRVG